MYKEIDKWRDVFKDNVLDLLENIDPYHPSIQSLYGTRFQNEFANIIFSVEEYYCIFEDGDEFMKLDNGKYLDDFVDENIDELREVIKKFKEELIEKAGGLKIE